MGVAFNEYANMAGKCEQERQLEEARRQEEVDAKAEPEDNRTPKPKGTTGPFVWLIGLQQHV